VGRSSGGSFAYGVLILMSSAYTSEEAALFARLYGDGRFIPKTEIGKELIPAIISLLS
jgi:hypothetical protein